MDVPHLSFLLPALLALAVLAGLAAWLRPVSGAPLRDPLRRGGEPVHGTVLASGRPRRGSPGRGAAGPPVTVRAESPDGRRTWEAVDDSGLGGYDPEPGTPVEGVYAPGDPSRLRIRRVARSGGDGFFEVRGGSRVGPLRIAGGVLTALVVAATAAIAVFAADGPVSPIGPVFVVVPGFMVIVGLRMTLGLLAGPAPLLPRLYLGRPPEAEGTVTDTWTEQRRSGSSRPSRTVYVRTVRFTTADGRRVHTRDPLERSSPGPEVGERVRVRYAESDPTLFVSGAPTPLDVLFGPGVPLVLGPALLVLGLSVLADFL
ncbi:hypothetical protein SUDANB121_04267 [Nocardiopsis dassonvillei]|uniref:DUF3592 domain-containing protein n=1 Tax=Nocardiopsis dassonvillei TaxID=2014 RepID=UPI003F562562